MPWMDGDLKVFAAGLAVGGEWNSAAGGKPALEPLLWYDEGEYNHFYIGFKKPISEFSYGQFAASVYVVAQNQLLPVSGAKRINTTTAIVYANITGQTRGVLVAGVDNGWLTFQNGEVIPAFAGSFTVEGPVNYVDLCYCYDPVGFPELFREVSEHMICNYPQNSAEGTVRESISIPPLFTGTEQVQISYYAVE